MFPAYIKLAFNDGVKIGHKIGEQVNEAIMSGHIKLQANESFEVKVNITDMVDYDFSLRDKILAKMGSPLVMSSGNAGLSIGGGAILIVSGKNYLKANNKVAKLFYMLSMACSGTGTISAGIAVYCDKCGLSKTAMLGDGFGGLFVDYFQIRP